MNYLVLLPKYVDCTPYYPEPNLTNQSSMESNITTRNLLDGTLRRIIINGEIRKIEPVYNYSREYGRSVITDVRIFFYIK